MTLAFQMSLSGTLVTDWVTLLDNHTYDPEFPWQFNTTERFKALRYLVAIKHKLINQHLEDLGLSFLKDT
jgi:hypothetical protein